MLQEHVTKVQLSQQKKESLQYHYLSFDSHKEFIGLCVDYVRKYILEELKKSKFYSIIVEATQDAMVLDDRSALLVVGLSLPAL